MDLARELRNDIYHAALVLQDRPSVAFLRVNKQIYTEAKKIFEQDNQYVHVTTNFLNLFTAKSLQAVPFTNLSRDDELQNPGKDVDKIVERLQSQRWSIQSSSIPVSPACPEIIP